MFMTMDAAGLEWICKYDTLSYTSRSPSVLTTTEISQLIQRLASRTFRHCGDEGAQSGKNATSFPPVPLSVILYPLC